MLEALLVLGAVACLALLGFVGPILEPMTVLLCGAAITGLGLAGGIPTGLWYHVVLWRHLRPRGPLPPRWWIHPVNLHDQLLPEQRRHVMAWFIAGGIGFGIVVLGFAVMITGVGLQWLAIRR